MSLSGSEILAEVLAARVRSQPHAPFLTRGEECWSNQEFFEICRRLAFGLKRAAGDSAAIGVSASSSARLPFLIWASVLAEVDLWFLPVLPTEQLLLDSVKKLPLGISFTDTALADTPFLDTARPLRPLESLLDGIDANPVPAGHPPRTGRFVFQTSGTEGAPKSIACEHWKFARVINAMLTCGALNHAVCARVYVSQPLQHSYGLCAFLEYVSAGGEIVLPPEASPLGPAGDLMQIGGTIQAIEGVPYFWSQFAQLQKRFELPALRHVGLGGGRVDAVVMQKIFSRFPAVTMSVRYGLTETPSVATHKVYTPPHGDVWPSSGRIIPAYQVEIRDGDDCPVPPGTEGEIHVVGECVSSPDGVLKTGDLGYIDGSGELIVTGRRSAFIKRRGYRLSPETVESAAASLEGIADCRAVGVDEKLVLEVVSGKDLSVPLLLEQLRSQLPATMVPDEIRRVESIPRTYSGKIKRN
jgi:acyl-CoA synthetase (AMP-forming)/AMP-acid ligase II